MAAKVLLQQLAVVSLTVFLISGCSSETVESQGDAEQRKRQQRTPAFKPQVVIPKAFPAIVQPQTVSATEANKSVHAAELVLGVEINGASRAYPINMLTGPQREIINDRLGGRAIAATW